MDGSPPVLQSGSGSRWRQAARAGCGLAGLVGRSYGLLISSPEYANGVPGTLINALDWLVSCVEFPGKPVALIDVSPGSIFVHESLGEILRMMSATLIDDPAFTIPLPRRGVDRAAMLADPLIARFLRAALDAFVDAAMP